MLLKQVAEYESGAKNMRLDIVELIKTGVGYPIHIYKIGAIPMLWSRVPDGTIPCHD
jgi:hypothetical protein